MARSPAPIKVVLVPERLDAASVEEFRGVCARILDEEGVRGLVLDFSETNFVDSVGLGYLVSLLKTCNQRGIGLALAAFTPQVRQIFDLTRLYRLFEIFETTAQAEAFLHGSDERPEQGA